MKAKLIFLSTAYFLSFFLTIGVRPVNAATFVPPCPRNTPFICVNQINSILNPLLDPILDALDSFSAQINTINTKVSQLELGFVNLSGDIDTLKADNLKLHNKVLDLETRLASLEATPTPSSKHVTFAENRPQPFDSEWIETTGYSHIKINVSITGFITQYDVHYSSTNGSLFTIQQTVNCNSSTMCPEVSLPVLGKYYRVSTGTASGNVTATGLLFKD